LVQQILKYLNKIKNLFVIIPLMIGIMLVTGLFFANKKSVPEFSSKPEKVMFDTKNQSPKYVITLPEKARKTDNIEQDDGLDKIQEPIERHKTNNEKLNELDIPFLSRLKKQVNAVPLSNIKPLAKFRDQETKLPIKSENLKVWEVYGNKVDVMPMFNKVVVVIKNMGGNKINSDLIIEKLHENVSLSFSPYASALVEQIDKARGKGHETYLDVILPSRNYLLEDSGALALDFSQSVENNLDVLKKMLSINAAIGGVIVRDGVDTEEYNEYFIAMMTMLEKSGLLMLDATHGENISVTNVRGLDRVRADILIDEVFDKSVIEKQLEQAEKIAYRNGSVVIVLDPKPVAVLAVADWIDTFSRQLSYEEMKANNITEFEKPLILVPLSNVAVEY